MAAASFELPTKRKCKREDCSPVLVRSTARVRRHFNVFARVLIFQKFKLLQQNSFDAVNPLAFDFQRRCLNGEHLRATMKPHFELPLVAAAFQVFGQADL